MKREGNDLVLSTGTRLNGYAGIIGLSDSLETYSGYDSELPLRYDVGDRAAALTADELRELADYMLERWQRFRDAADQIAAEQAELAKDLGY